MKTDQASEGFVLIMNSNPDEKLLAVSDRILNVLNNIERAAELLEKDTQDGIDQALQINDNLMKFGTIDKPKQEAVSLPKERTRRTADIRDEAFDNGFNECLAEVEKFGPLYTHADDGEVERLLAENKRLDLLVSQADYNYDCDRDHFRQQLAESQSLLRDWYPGCGLTARQTQALRERTDAFLSTIQSTEAKS